MQETGDKRAERIKQLEQIISQQPEEVFPRYALALEYMKAGSDQKAISAFEQLVERNPDYLGSYYQLGQLYVQTKQPAQAISTWTKGITVAKAQGDRKTAGELQQAIDLTEEEME